MSRRRRSSRCKRRRVLSLKSWRRYISKRWRVAASAWWIPGRSAVAVETASVGKAIGLHCVLTGLVELALEVRLGNLQVTKRHTDVFVTHQLHESGQANATAEQV
jgi:hypothetical protein